MQQGDLRSFLAPVRLGRDRGREGREGQREEEREGGREGGERERM